MKNKVALIVMIITIAPALCIAQQFTDPVSYMNHISKQYKEIMKNYMSYTSTVAHSNSAKKVEARRKALIETVKEARKAVVKMPPYEGDKGLRDSVASFLQLSYLVLAEDYGKIINLEEVAEQSYDAMEAYMLAQELASKKLEEGSAMMENAEKTFATNNNVQLVEGGEDKLAKKLQKASEVNKYHQLIYLIFFKSYKQEIYLNDALNTKDINGIEQNKNSLIKFATEGLTKLDSIPSYQMDGSLKVACQHTLKFYLNESNQQIPKLTSFYLKEENFEKIKKAFEVKKENTRTSADVNKYNTEVNEINKALDEANAVSKDIFEGRKKAIENWNKSSQNFLSKHVPKY